MTEQPNSPEVSGDSGISRDRRALIGQILAWIPRDEDTGRHAGKRRVQQGNLSYDVVVSSPDPHEATVIVVHPNHRVTTYDFSTQQEELTRRVHEPDAEALPPYVEHITFGSEYEQASEELRRLLARYAITEA